MPSYGRIYKRQPAYTTARKHTHAHTESLNEFKTVNLRVE